MDREHSIDISIQKGDELCRRIEELTEKETREILEKATEEREKILAEARRIAQDKEKEIFASASKDIEKIKDRFFSMLNIEKRRFFLEERARFVDKVVKAVQRLAVEFRQDAAYRKFLKEAIIEGAGIIGTDAINIKYSWLDERLVNDNSFLDEVQGASYSRFHKDISFQFIKSEFSDIGVVLESRDGRIVCDNSFSARFRRMYENIYMEIVKELG